MKICVLVKEVPDAAVEKRIDPSTGRMDRSGEKNLNPYDTHAIEAAMQIKEGGERRGRRGRRRDDGPRHAPCARCTRPSRSAPTARCTSPTTPWPAPTSPPPATRWPRCSRQESPDLVLLGQQSDDGECYTIGAVVADHLKMPSLTQVIKMDVDRAASSLRAPGRVRLRHRRGRAARRDLGRRRDQRAALPVAQGDHGRQEEAARDARRIGDVGHRRRPGRRRGLAGRLRRLQRRRPPEGRRRDHRGRGHRRDGREDRRLARREEADLAWPTS